MFASTLDHTEAFLKSICCDQCHQPSDKLQFIGSSCKHVFCWTCINAICDRKSFPLCPLCLLPIGLQHLKSATFADQLFLNVLSLKEILAAFAVSQFDRQLMLSLVETNEQRRTVEEFCSTQECAEMKDIGNEAIVVQSEELLSKTTSLLDNVAPSAQVDFVAGTSTQMDNVSGTSAQNNISMTQQSRVYDEPKNFQFFKERPKNTYGNTVAKKSMSIHSEHGLKDRSVTNPDRTSLKRTSVQNFNKSPSQRYEYHLVNAAIRGSKKKLLEALEAGEDANQCDNLGLTALYHAAAHNYTEICKILIDNGAVINAYGGELCETALHAAVRWQAIDAVEYLLSKGANRRAYNLKDKTPMDLISNDEIREIFGRISHPIKIVYSYRKCKKCSVFISSTLPAVKLKRGKLLFSDLSSNAMNFETATHLIVQEIENRAAEITKAMLRGQYILTNKWLDACLNAKDIINEGMYGITAIYRDGQLLAKNSCTMARENYIKMEPELFRGCHFYFCKHEYLPYREREIKKLVQLAGGVILGREPKVEEYIESGIRPYHARRAGNNGIELFGLFAVYMPGQSIPQRVAKQKYINLITPIWIMECIAAFTLLQPENR